LQIDEILWPDDRVEHLGRHGVAPPEVEEVCFGRALVLRARSEGINPVYHVLGETESGRMLLCIVIRFPGGKGYPVTAREMTSKEQRRYLTWRGR